MKTAAQKRRWISAMRSASITFTLTLVCSGCGDSDRLVADSKMAIAGEVHALRNEMSSPLVSLLPTLPQPGCTPSGFCWEKPLQTGEVIRDIATLPDDSAWAVGTNGAVLRSAGLGWTLVASGTYAHLNGVWAVGSDAAWAVGNGGTILRWDGFRWSSQFAGTTEDLSAVWGSDRNNIYVAGAKGTLLRWNGSRWSLLSSGTTNGLRAVWGSSAASVWVVGDGGTILRCGTGGCTSESSGTSMTLSSVWGSSADDLWVGGWSGYLRSDGRGTWRVNTTPATFLRITGRSTTDIWALRPYSLVRWNGISWDPASIGSFTNNYLCAIGKTSTGLLLGGSYGLLLRQDVSGTRLENGPPNTENRFRKLAVYDENNIWAVGSSLTGHAGLISRWDGSRWYDESPSGAVPLTGVWASNRDDVWAVGNKTIWRRQRGSWLPQANPSTEGLKAIWGIDSNHIWAFESSGPLFWNGSTWTKTRWGAGTYGDVQAAHGCSASDIWVVGASGNVVHWNGITWESRRLGSFAYLTGVYCGDSRHVWVVSLHGQRFRWDGTNWNEEPLSPGSTYEAIWGSSPDDVWISGTHLMHYSGGSWTKQAGSEETYLFDVTGRGKDSIWAIDPMQGLMRLRIP